MQKKCRRCGGVSRELTCEGCGVTFVHKKEKAQGRWPKYCPECLPKYSKVPKKKEETVQAIAEKIVKAIEEPEVKVTPKKEDVINHPSHYTRGNIEVIDFIEDQQLPYHLGNVIKYIARAGHKGDKLEDLKKARWYLDRYINEVMQHE